jgi:hypothetical protein
MLRNSGSDYVELGRIAPNLLVSPLAIQAGDVPALPGLFPEGIAHRPDVDPGDLSNVVAWVDAKHLRCSLSPERTVNIDKNGSLRQSQRNRPIRGGIQLDQDSVAPPGHRRRIGRY